MSKFYREVAMNTPVRFTWPRGSLGTQGAVVTLDRATWDTHFEIVVPVFDLTEFLLVNLVDM